MLFYGSKNWFCVVGTPIGGGSVPQYLFYSSIYHNMSFPFWICTLTPLSPGWCLLGHYYCNLYFFWEWHERCRIIEFRPLNICPIPKNMIFATHELLIHFNWGSICGELLSSKKASDQVQKVKRRCQKCQKSLKMTNFLVTVADLHVFLALKTPQIFLQIFFWKLC